MDLAQLRADLLLLRAEVSRILGTLAVPDTTPPVVSLTASATAFTQPGTLTLTAAPVGAVARVEYLRGGVKIGESFTAPHTLPVPITGSGQAGTYTARAVKASGAAASSAPLGITVDIVITPPTVSLTLSAASFTQAGTLSLTATAASERGIKQVAYYWGAADTGTLIGTATAPPYTVTRAIAPADNGAQTVTAVVTDNGTPALTAQDAEAVSVNIAPPVQLPTLSLTPTSAVTGATLTASLGRLQVDDTLDWGDGTVVDAQSSLSHVYASSGPYTVSVMRGGVAAVSEGVTISTPVIGITYDPPITISAGGVYSGNWQSPDDRTIPAVNITTTEPITIHTGHVRGRGDLIRARKTGARVTIRNMTGEGLNPGVRGKPQGRFADLQGLSAALVEHCEFDGTGGIYCNGYTGNSTTDTFLVRYNFGRNINGRFADGYGGYMTGQADFYRLQFCQFNHVYNIPGARIEWNRVLNEPRQSHVEDNVNMSDTTGKSDSDRIIIQRNLIEGGYGTDPAGSYSGGGIMLGDGGGAYQTAQFNTVLETSNYGAAVADGNHMSILSNVILGIGKLADGTYLDANSDAGIYVRDYVTATPRDPATVLVDGNTVGWGTPTPSNANSRYDIGVQAGLGTLGTNTTLPPGPITQATLDAARQAWLDSVVAASLTIGRTS